MTIRRGVSAVVIAALLGMIAPTDTWAGGADPATSKNPGTGRLQAAISRAASDASANPSLQLTSQPATQPATPVKSRARMQSTGGGGHTGMIIGLVTAAVGIAATVYAVKAVQKETKAVQQPQ
jgi:hypothetical protein